MPNLSRNTGKLRRHGLSVALIALLAVVSAAPAAEAIIVLGSQQRNLTPPTGKYENSGWQYQGIWGRFLGTAISPYHFITARHVGGLIGDPFIYRGKKYETINVHKFTNCDLSIWTVAEPMPDYAPLYLGNKEVGRDVVLFGRGTSRGEAVVIDNRLRGWRWGPSDGRMSWGRSRIARIVPSGGYGDLSAGEKLCFDFLYEDDPNAGSVSSGDSGGGVFIQDEKRWKLVGINYGVSGQYSSTGSPEDQFSAAIFDGRGFWQRYGEGFTWTHELDRWPATTLSFATRIAPYTPTILDIVNQPPRRQIFTRRRLTLFGVIGFLLVAVAYIYRVRHLLRGDGRRSVRWKRGSG